MDLGGVARLGGGGAGGLVCTGELGGQGKDHDVLPRGLGALNGLGERVGVDLAGSGKLIALDEEFVETLARELDIGLVRGGTEPHGKRQDVELGMIALKAIGTGVGDDANGHNGPLQIR